MHAVIFDLDHTIFAADNALHADVAGLLAILKNLGLRIGAISGQDHRALVRLDEAGIRHYFSEIICSANAENPKTTAVLLKLLQQLGAPLDQVALVSHAHADILLGKDAGVGKTIGVSHGTTNTQPLYQAGADHVVDNIPLILDVLDI